MTELAVVDAGRPAGPPIVWLGSLGSAMAMWDRQVAEFAATRRCLLLDHPGHGASPPASEPLTIDVIAADVLDALDRIGVGRADFVGLSLGAMVSMSIAANSPFRVGRLALLCTSARFEAALPWHERAAVVRTSGTASVAETVVGRWLTPDYAAAHADEVAAFVAMVGHTDDESYARCCEAIAEMDLRPLLPAIGAPTLVVAGTADPATPPPHAAVIAAGIRGSKLESVDAAHLANWERADGVNRLLATHLGEGEP
jgi:3-oxoadipate enol-lactonase